MEPNTIGSLFSGIGGLELGLERAGLGRTLWQVELDPFARRILQKHWPEAERHTDIRECGAHNLRPVSVMCGGFPCQDISVAGKGVGLNGARSGLWREFRRIVSELRPGWVVIENVHRGWRRWVPVVRRDIGHLGYASVPIRVRASDVGAWHERSRCFIVADRLGALLRQQPGGGLGARWARAAEPRNDGAQGFVADAYGEGQLQPGGGVATVRRWARDCDWWTAEPEVARVVHGLPGRVDRVRCLGNAVVPQVAEVIGRIIKGLQ